MVLAPYGNWNSRMIVRYMYSTHRVARWPLHTYCSIPLNWMTGMRDLAGGAAVHRLSQWRAAAMDAYASCVVFVCPGPL